MPKKSLPFQTITTGRAALYIVFLWPVLAAASPRCELGGKPVNPYNGQETAGLTGVLRCTVPETGKLANERELRAGKFIGQERFYDPEGRLQRERTINERGNTDGFEKEYWPNGKLRSESAATNGAARGLSRSFFETGQQQRASFTLDGQALVSMSWDPQGNLLNLSCPQTSVLPEDRKVCGFDGKVQTTLFQNGKRREVLTIEQGKVLAATTYRAGQLNQGIRAQGVSTADNEVVWAEMAFKGEQRWHRVYNTEGTADRKNVLREERLYEPGRNFLGDAHRLTSSAGRLQWSKAWGANEQLTEHIRYANGLPVLTERWYLNGAIREKITVTPENGGSKMVRESYDDAAHISSVQTTFAIGSAREQRVGIQKTFHENGQTAMEETYSPLDERARTRLVARKQWDEAGKLLADDEILEDGSRKRR